MSFRELSMLDVRELLRRRAAGQSARQVARDGVADRKTALRYFEAAAQLEIGSDAELSDELVARVALRVQSRPKPPPSPEWQSVVAARERIEGWLKATPPLRLIRVHELLRQDGIRVGYTTLRRFAHEELGWRERRVTVRVDDPPAGEEAQIDFGLMGMVVDDDGRRRKLWVLVVTLSMSRYTFVWPTFEQTVDALCEGLDAAWRFFGGVPRRIVPDNMSSVISRAHPQEPVIHRAFLEYAQSRGFFVDAARVRRPQDKARVENQIPYVRERWFDGGGITADLDLARESAATWCREIAGQRIHGTTRRVPREVYESEEINHMLAAPLERFDVPSWTRAKVHPDHHVQVGRALYSVPTRFVGRTLEARVDRNTVRLYIAGELVKMHGRVPAGKRSTDASDYPAGKAEYAMRSVDGVKSRARARGAHVGEYAERLLAGPLPWTKMRQAYGLLRLCERFGAERVDAICARSLAFDVVDVARIDRMLRAAHQIEVEAESSGKVTRLPASPARFERDRASFATRKGSAERGAQ
jgi:transposase